MLKIKIIKKLILFLFVCISVQSSVEGWWDMGHMAVAQIAYEELKPEVKTKMDLYLEAVSSSFPNHGDFISASVWADDIAEEGISAFFVWHGSARPYNPEKILSEKKVQEIVQKMEGNDIVWAIQQCLKTLRSPKATFWAKGFMLRMLIHIVGDIHQPNHCITLYNHLFPEGDRAGTKFKISHPVYSSLHSLFDAAFGQTDRRPERPMTPHDKSYLNDLVSSLKKSYSRNDLKLRLINKEVDRWRAETYKIGIEFVYNSIEFGEKPSPKYMEEGKKITGRQLALAGYRLADLLNDL